MGQSVKWILFSAQHIAGQMKDVKEENVALRKEIDEMKNIKGKHCMLPTLPIRQKLGSNQKLLGRNH